VEIFLQYFVKYHLPVIFVGTVIEGEVVLIAGGFLVSEGLLSFPVLLSVSTFAAVLGDNFFFWLGRSQRTGARHPLAARFVNFIGEHRLFRGEEFLRRHGGKSVFLIRFLYGLRFAGAMTAGYLGMPFNRFFFFNLIGCATWALVLGGSGYLFGRSLEAVDRSIRLAKIGAILVLGGLVAIYLVNKWRRRNRV
jgi:membrane-associated protein